jgi:hypothetical protein
MTSTIKVNKIEKVDGSTIEIGGPGTAVNLACGATQTGFGRTGTVNWCTTAKTSPLTAENGKGYFIDTTSGGVTVTLPSSPSAGSIVAVKDYAKQFDNNALTLCRNGSKIGGNCVNALLETEGVSTTLVYVDGTKGWLVVNDGLQSQAPTAAFIAATGGSVTTCGNFKIHKFASDGTFCVSSAGNACGSNTVDYLVVAGGGGGAGRCNVVGGGGAGGFRLGAVSAPGCASPLTAAGLPVTATGFPITVGAGGAGGGTGSPAPNTTGVKGSNSIFSSITSTGGGAAGGGGSAPACRSGGSGGGASQPAGTGGSGNTPPVNPAQGTNGGNGGSSPAYAGGGGGGATCAGANATSTKAGNGGAGAPVTEIFGASPKPFYEPTNGVYAGGGGGGYYTGCGVGSGAQATGGTGGGGNSGPNSRGNGVSGTTNTGGGGGGAVDQASYAYNGGNGGSGVVLIRYKFQ